MSKVQKIAQDYSISAEEAQKLIDTVMNDASGGSTPKKVRRVAKKDTQRPQSELQTMNNQIREVEDRYLTAEMYRKEAYKDGNKEGYGQFDQEMTTLSQKLHNLRSSRRKIAQEFDSVYGDEEVDENYNEIAQDLASEGDLDEEVLGEAVGYATELMNDPNNNLSKEEAEDIARFRINRPLNAARAYAFLRHLDSPLACPKCSSQKIARMDNPNYMQCDHGHVSELILEKVASDPFGEPSQRENQSSEAYDEHDEEKEDFYGRNNMDNAEDILHQIQRYVGNPEMSDDDKVNTVRGLVMTYPRRSESSSGKRKKSNEILDTEAPSVPEGGQPEEGGLGLDRMGEQEKVRLKGALTSSSGSTPLHVLGVIDGFLGTQYFADMFSSEEEQQDYQTGSREGMKSNSGYST